MGDYPNLLKPPTQLLSSPSPPPPAPHRSSMPILYYGLVVVATAAIVLAIYNLIVIRWCATQYHRPHETNRLSRHRRNTTTRNNIMPPPSALHRSGSTIGLTSSFRYKKGNEENNFNSNNNNNNSNSNSDSNNNEAQLDYDIECSVCLSVFEDGEEVRKLPVCKHSFHASCIDMWLYSHFDCPLFRAPVVLLPMQATPPQHQHTDSTLSEQSRDGLIDRASSST